MRVFIALPITEEVKKACLDLQKKLKSTGVKMKLVEPENIHITLKFLGEIGEEKVEKIKRIIDSIKLEKINAKTTFVSSFPSSEFIRVVWLGVDSNQILKTQRELDEKIERELGISKEKNFVPHITLARVKEKPNKKLKELIGIRKEIVFDIDRIILMESKLTRGGPVYEVVYEKRL